MTQHVKQCWKCKRFKPATKEHFYRNRTMPDGWQSGCKKCDRARGLHVNAATPRDEQGKGVYLAILKLTDGNFLAKIGRTNQIRSRAGRLASDARKTTGLDIEWGEVLYFVEEDDMHEQLELEAAVIASTGPDLGAEYFLGERWDEFTAFIWMAKAYTERSTHQARSQEFYDWLSFVSEESLRS